MPRPAAGSGESVGAVVARPYIADVEGIPAETLGKIHERCARVAAPGEAEAFDEAQFLSARIGVALASVELPTESARRSRSPVRAGPRC